LATTASSLSKDRNADYNPNDPNVTLQTTILGKDGLYEDFSTSLSGWTKISNLGINPNENISTPHMGNATTWTIENGKLKMANSGGENGSSVDAFYYTLNNELKGRVGVEFTIKTDSHSNGLNFGVALGDGNWQPDQAAGSAVFTAFNLFNNWQYLNNTTSSYVNIGNWLKGDHSYRLKIVVDIDNHKAEYFIDGKPCLKSNLYSISTTGIKKLSFYTYGCGSATTWYIDDLMIYTDPVQTVVYSDGLGKELQSIADEDENEALVTGKLYDDLGREFIQTRPTRLYTWLDYKPNFATGINSIGEIIGDIVVNNNNEKYCFSRTVFENSPLGRVIETSIPGEDYKIGGGHSTKHIYSSTMPPYLFGSFPPTDFFITETQNSDGISSFAIKD